jgi:hypothetical protein
MRVKGTAKSSPPELCLSFASWSRRSEKEDESWIITLYSDTDIFEFQGCRAQIATISLSHFQRMTTPTNTIFPKDNKA